MGNLTEDYSTNTHDQLSPKGQQQAEALIPRLQAPPLTHLYCSPMKRALETIAPFVAHTRKPVYILPDLTEACWGSCSRSEPETPPEYIQTDILKDFEGLPFHFADNKPLRPVEPESFATGLTHLHLDTPHPKLFYFNRLS